MGKLVGIVQFKGKVGEVVGSKGKKSMILRAYQPDVKQANTVPQVKARVKFLTLTALSKTTKKLQFALANYAADKSLTVSNAFSKLNASAVTVADPTQQNPDFEGQIDWSKVRFSQGDVPGVIFRRPDLTTPGVISSDISDPELTGLTPEAKQATTRRVFLAAVCPATAECFVSDPTNPASGSVTTAIPDSWNGQAVEVFGWVMDFNTAEEAIAYDSYWTSGAASLEAKATIARMQAAARYSTTQYLGNGEIG